MNLPDHQQENYNRVSLCINRIRGLVDAINDAITMTAGDDLCNNPRKSRIFHTLSELLEAEVKKADRAHTQQWVGMGGSTESLTNAEIQEARGETPADR